MSGIAPILERIASIESRFGSAPPPRPIASSSTSPTNSTLSTSATLSTPASPSTGGRSTTGATGTSFTDRLDQALAAAETSFPGVTVGGTALPPGLAVVSSGSSPSLQSPFQQSSTSPSAAPAATSSPSTPITPTALTRPALINDANRIVATVQVAATSPTAPHAHVSPAAGGGVPAGTPFAAEFTRSATEHGVPPELLAAVGWVESRYDVNAVSPDGAIGLMQIMPGTAAHLGVNPHDPVDAIDGAARLLRSNFDRFGSWELSLAAYFSGPGAVAAAGNQAPPRGAEYAQRVITRMNAA